MQSPVVFFKHDYSQYPFVIIETSYLQYQKELMRLADKYISGSDVAIYLASSISTGSGEGRRRASGDVQCSGSRCNSFPACSLSINLCTSSTLMGLSLLLGISYRRRNYRSRARIISPDLWFRAPSCRDYTRERRPRHRERMPMTVRNARARRWKPVNLTDKAGIKG